MGYKADDSLHGPGRPPLFDDNKPSMIAVVTDAGLLPQNARHTAIRYDDVNGKEYERARHEKGGWITLNWEREPEGIARDNEGDPTGIKEVTILVTVERALQAMSALVRDKLIC